LVYGRAEIADRVARNEAPIILVTGDSGIGKSTVLRMACDKRRDWITPPPIPLIGSAGALHTGVLDQLGAALALLIDDGLAVSALGERLALTGRRLAHERISVLGRVALAELVAVVRGRVGEDVGKAVAEYAGDIWPSTAETLAAKAAQSRDPLAVEVLSTFGEAAVALAGEAKLGLALDQGQRLGDDDRRLLADLGDRVPSGLHLRIAFATDTAARVRSVAAVRAEVAAIDEIEVPPLDEDAISEWLTARQLDSSLAGRLTRQTGGYPLLVEAAVEHLKNGGELEEVPRHEQLAARTRASWQHLSPAAAATARKLSVLPDPLAEAELRELAGIRDVGDWATVVAELSDARIFSVVVNGRPWFHNERRAFVLSECLTDSQRDEVASAAAALLWSNGITTTDFARVTLFAELVSLAPSFQADDSQIAAALQLEGEALAAAAALLELAVQERLAAEADTLFSHALSFIGSIDDPAATLAVLDDANLVVTASNEWSTAVAAGWGPKTQAIIQGKSARLLHRAPVPRLVELMFQVVLRDQLGDFEAARFGIGSPSVGSLGRIAAGADPEGGYVDRRRLGPSLLLGGVLIDEIPFYSAIGYRDDAARDSALSRLMGLKSNTVIGNVEVRSAAPHPTSPVPVQRFAAAFRRARHESADHVRETGQIRLPAPDGMSVEQVADSRVLVAQALSERSSASERAAMELDDGYLLAWDADEESWDECVIHGAGFAQRRVPTLGVTPFRDQYEGLMLRQALGLKVAETVVHRSTSMGKNVLRDPLAAEISYRRERARRYNSGQSRLPVVLSREELEPQIRNAFLREMSDARALQKQFPRSTSDVPLEPRSLWLLIALDEEDPHWVAGARGVALYSEGHSRDGSDQAFVELVQGRLKADQYLYTVEDEVFREVFPDASDESWGSSTVDYIIAKVLGHHPDDVELLWPA
jgi:hypothetical protein